MYCHHLLQFRHNADSSENDIYYLTLVLTPIPEVTISGGDVTVRKGESVRLIATGAESYIWSSGETNPIIDVYPTETTTYTVTGYNGSCSSTASTTIIVEGTIGIHTAERNDISLFPNPTTATVNINFKPGHIVVTDATGRKVIEFESTEKQCTLDVSNLPNGIYFVQANGNDGSKATAKFIKK